MPDIADFSDELAALIQEMLEAGVEREEIKKTLTAKREELDEEDRQSEAWEPEKRDAESGDNDNGGEEPA